MKAPTSRFPAIASVSFGLFAAALAPSITAFAQESEPTDPVPAPFDSVAEATFTEVTPLPVVGPSQCPRSLRATVVGESVAGGLKYTVDVKALLVPGTLRVTKGPANGYAGQASNEYLIFEGRLRPAFAACAVDVFPRGIMGTTVRRFTLSGGKLRYVFKDPVNLIYGASTWNDQIIHSFRERL